MISFVSFSLSAHSQNKKEPSSGADVVSSDTLGRMELMHIAIAEAREGIRAGHGGPFGTVIVKNGKIVGRGHNCVLSHNDPTCHGEVAAIRDAGKNIVVDGMQKDYNSQDGYMSEFSRKARTKGSKDLSLLYAFNPSAFRQRQCPCRQTLRLGSS